MAQDHINPKACKKTVGLLWKPQGYESNYLQRRLHLSTKIFSFQWHVNNALPMCIFYVQCADLYLFPVSRDSTNDPFIARTKTWFPHDAPSLFNIPWSRATASNWQNFLFQHAHLCQACFNKWKKKKSTGLSYVLL